MRKLSPLSVLTFLVTVAAFYGKAKYGYGFFGGK
jgi:hypothetical protein